MSKIEIPKFLGDPQSISPWEGSDVFVYNNFSIILSRIDPKQQYKIIGIGYNILKNNFTLQELLIALGNPKNVYFNNHDGIWEISYLVNNINIIFKTNDLNDYLSILTFSTNK